MLNIQKKEREREVHGRGKIKLGKLLCSSFGGLTIGWSITFWTRVAIFEKLGDWRCVTPAEDIETLGIIMFFLKFIYPNIHQTNKAITSLLIYLVMSHIFRSWWEFSVSLDDFIDGIQEILFSCNFSSGTNCVHSSFGTNGTKFGTSWIWTKTCN